ncbi:hypothetical protein MTY66_57880 [Mycolicibacterium sp. TY66]|uniref:helix-turn-helix transcriptional regulator n=1 Tax=unclassified Mycolicibacterium TaxID=2636767 RepID=UPI001BB59141|nr:MULTISPECIES: helix-turn-helix domain-containing protein [unclassified Mycolicibacterium]BCI84163.1 hypothetical protein MTY66_57880 [Mycolicibacterium sp. TY66]BCJ84217.1 hypothetical protein MTY81_55900 [Mycolicibacterium sp. TY81]
MSDDVWLSRAEVSERTKIPIATLAVWAHYGKGPKYSRFGRHTRYRVSDVIAWEEAQYVGGGGA